MVDAAFGFSPKPSASVCCFFAHLPIRLLRIAYLGSGPKRSLVRVGVVIVDLRIRRVESGFEVLRCLDVRSVAGALEFTAVAIYSPVVFFQG